MIRCTAPTHVVAGAELPGIAIACFANHGLDDMKAGETIGQWTD